MPPFRTMLPIGRKGLPGTKQPCHLSWAIAPVHPPKPPAVNGPPQVLSVNSTGGAEGRGGPAAAARRVGVRRLYRGVLVPAGKPVAAGRLPARGCSLFLASEEGGQGNLGGTLRRAASHARLASNERLLEQLLAAPLSGLHGPLFEAVRRLAAVRVPVNWPQLIVDLGRWDWPIKNEELSVREAWANSWLNYGSEHVD